MTELALAIIIGFVSGATFGLLIMIRESARDHEWYVKAMDDYAKYLDYMLQLKCGSKTH